MWKIVLKFNLSLIIDGESIFMLSSSTSNGNSKFYTSNIRLAPEDVKYKKKKKKFEDHIMLKGCSKPYFLNKGISMNQYNYLKKCILKRVMPFIRQYHADNYYIFWPVKQELIMLKK